MGDAIENVGAFVAINDSLATVHGHMNMSALVPLFAGGWLAERPSSELQVRTLDSS